jgi:hypothetical protein
MIDGERNSVKLKVCSICIGVVCVILVLILLYRGSPDPEDTLDYREGYQQGKREAQSDMSSGKVYVYVYGYRNHLHNVDPDSGMICKAIAGCLVDNRTMGRANGYNDTVASWLARGNTPSNTYAEHKEWICGEAADVLSLWNVEGAKFVEGAWEDARDDVRIFVERYGLDHVKTKTIYADRIVIESGGNVRKTNPHGHTSIPRIAVLNNDPLKNAVGIVVECKSEKFAHTGFLIFDFKEMLPLTYMTTGKGQESPKRQVGDTHELHSRLSRSLKVSHSVLHDFVLLETMFGDGILDEKDISVYLAAIDDWSRRFAKGRRSFDDTFWKILVSLPLRVDRGTALAEELVERVRADKNSFHAQLFLALFEQGTDPAPSVKSLLEMVEQIRAGTTVKIPCFQEAREIPYLLLSNGGRFEKNLSRAEIISLTKANPGLLAFFLDALALKRRVDPGAVGALVSYAVSSKNRYAHLAAAELLAAHRSEDSEDLLTKLHDLVPYKIDNLGRKVYTSHTGGRDLDTELRRTVWLARRKIRLKDQYHKAREKGDLLGFMLEPMKLRDLLPVKAWVVYRYHPELFSRLFREYRKKGELQPLTTTELPNLIGQILEVNQLLPVEGVDVASIRRYVHEATEPMRRANALFVLKKRASDADMARLLDLARDGTVLEWKDNQGKRSNPLVAMWAVYCLAEIGSPKSKAAVRKISGDSSFPAKARAAAKEALAK